MAEWPEHGYVESDESKLYFWKARSLWKASEPLPIEQVNLESFDWENDNFQCATLSTPPLWRDIGNHMKRALAADLSFPIVISAEGNVMDGIHRILKCYAFDIPTISAVRFGQTPEADLIRPKDPARSRQNSR